MRLLPNRYNRENFKRLLRNSSLLFGELNRIGEKINRWYWQKHDASLNGFNINMKEWDNLLILDACRFDVFEKESSMDGELSVAISQGTSSWEFMLNNFVGNEYHDTVYVTANPYASRLEDDVFYRVYPLFQTHWDENLRTVPPDTVANQARQALAEHPNKRLIVHFMQPHAPYIGKLRKKIPHRGNTRAADRMERAPDDTRDIWTNLKYGLEDVDVETVRNAYIENLQIVLEEIEELVLDIDGKTVITADHGELFGERLFPIPVSGYGHPEGIHVSKLKKVPWLEIETGSRREITEGEPERFSTDEEIVENRLLALGYK